MKNSKHHTYNKQVFNWRITKLGKSVVSCFTSFLTGAIAISLFCSNIALAGPQGGNIVGGTGSITQDGSTTIINQETTRIDIDWQDFSSDAGDTINFNQPDNNSIAINRVIGGVPSNLRGELNANGRVFILNDSGITFHKGSQTNVGSLIATTAKEVTIDDNGVAHFTESGDAAVINKGNIIVSRGGFAVLVAPNVKNHGFIKANLGRIEMGSGTEFTFDLRGDEQVVYRLSEEDLENIGLTNTGVLRAKSGTINLSANAASEIRNAVVNLDGKIDADSFDTSSDGGTVLVSSKGDINLNDVDILAGGGTIKIAAQDTINLSTSANLDTDCGTKELSGIINFVSPCAENPDNCPAPTEPEEPAETPEEPVVTEPEQPVENPEEPVVTEPEQPAETPEEPVVTEPEEPAETPEEPVVTEPEEPAETPEEPVVTEPEEPAETPEEPTVILQDAPEVMSVIDDPEDEDELPIESNANSEEESSEFDSKKTFNIIEGYKYPEMKTEYIFFDHDKHNLDERAMKKLSKVLEEFSSGGISQLFIEGHTDLSGSDNYNVVLGKKRAAVTSNALHKMGIDKSTHSISSHGEAFPYIPTFDGVKIRGNRRVKIQYMSIK